MPGIVGRLGRASGLPHLVPFPHARATWPIASGDSRGFVREKDAILGVAWQRTQCSWTVELAVNLLPSVSTQLSGNIAFVSGPIRQQELVRFGHAYLVRDGGGEREKPGEAYLNVPEIA
jgi:hypothetical protein